MKDLATQLRELGLISEKQHQLAQAEKELQGGKLHTTAKSIDDIKECDELDRCVNISEFKHAAKKILLRDRSLIGQVIGKAHRFKKQPGGDKLVWMFYQIRDGLKQLPAEKQEQFLNRALRKSGGTIALPE